MIPKPWADVPIRFVGVHRVRLDAAVAFETYALERGTETDGATIPRVLWWLPMIGHPLQGDVLVPSALHDVLLRERLTLTAMEAHRVFFRALRANGVGRFRASLFFCGVVVKNPWWRTL